MSRILTSLRPTTRADLDSLVALSQRVAPPADAWTRARAEDLLFDLARGEGTRVRVAEAAGSIVGVVGWVKAGLAQGEFYGAPILAMDRTVARCLVDHAVDRAIAGGARWIRIGASEWETILADTLAERGFVEVNAFVTLDRDTDVAAPPRPSDAHPVDAIDPEALAELHNVCFAAVANAPPMDAAGAIELWDDVAPEASEVWADDQGRYRGYIAVGSDGEIEAVGVHPDLARRGWGRCLVLRALAASSSPRARSLVAEDNLASLALHEGSGFRRVARRRILQRDL